MAFGRMAAGALVLFAVIGSEQPMFCESARVLSFSEIRKRWLKPSIFRSTGLSVSSNGVVYSTASERREVRSLSVRDGTVRKLRLRGLPEEINQWELGPEAAADQRGFLYVAGHGRQWSLREEAPSRLFGVSVFRPDGRYSFTIHLTPSVDVRHIVVDGTGELFVLGIDLSSLYRPAGGCLLVHKYSRRGTRLTSFSQCPAPELARSAGEQPGQLFLRRQTTVMASQLFLHEGVLYHVLFSLRIIRMFDTQGRLIRELHLEPPSGAPLGTSGLPQPANVGDEVVRVVLIQEGRFLVEWAHAEQSQWGQRKVRYLGVYDGQGRALSEASPEPAASSVLLCADKTGDVYFLGTPTNGHQELLRTRVCLH